MILDTPGIHKAKNKLGEYMVNVAERTFKDADVILWLEGRAHHFYRSRGAPHCRAAEKL